MPNEVTQLSDERRDAAIRAQTDGAWMSLDDRLQTGASGPEAPFQEWSYSSTAELLSGEQEISRRYYTLARLLLNIED